MNGAQQIVGGLLAYCFTLIKPGGPLKSWQALFMTYGCFTVLYGFFVMWWMPDSPMRAKCFSESDKKLMVERVRSNQTGLQNRKFRREHIIEAFKDPQMYGYCLIQICTTLPTSGLGAFANIIITSFNFTNLETQLLAMVLGFYIIIVLFSSMWLVNKTGQNLLVMGIYVIPYDLSPSLLLQIPHVRIRFYVYLTELFPQLFYRHNRANDRQEHRLFHQSRPPGQLLHHSVVLVRANFSFVHDVPQRCRSNEEVRGCRSELCGVGRRKRRR